MRMKRYMYSHHDEHETFGMMEGYDTITEASAAADAHPERPMYILDSEHMDELHTCVAWRDNDDGTWEHSEDFRYDDR